MRREFTLTLVALALLALTACDKKPASVHDGKGYPILFGCTDTTRADVGAATIEDLRDNGFRVYSFVDGVNDISFTKDVYWVENNKVWAYDNLEYWVPGCKYSFRAFYPNPKDNYTLNVDTSSVDLSYKIDNFDITSQQDLMQASATANVAPGNVAPGGGSVVDLDFQHLLANVTIKIKAEINVTIKDVTLKFVPVKGSYTNGIWSYTTQGNIEKTNLNKTLNSSNKEFQDVTDGGFLVFPNNVGDARLFIDTSNKSYDIKLPATPSAWIAGTKYTYTLTIKQNDILFDEPTVEEWDEENATGSVVIK